MKRFLLTLCAICATTALWAATATVNGITWTYSVTNGKATIGTRSRRTPAISQSTSGSIVIPSRLGGYPVTSIGNGAFYNCSGLTSVTIPSSVTEIGNFAFTQCFSLTSVTIPDSVTKIGKGAFSYCSGLTSVVIPEGVTKIGEGTFFSCRSLTSVAIPEGVTKIGRRAFYCCWGLTSITIPDSVTTIENRAFSCCINLTSVIIPDGVTEIGKDAFFGCRHLTIEVVEENLNYSSQDGALFNKEKTILINGPRVAVSYTIPSRVTEIRDGAFAFCPRLTSVTIPEGVTEIGDGAFVGCAAIREMIFKGPPPRVEPLSDDYKQFFKHEGFSNLETLPATMGYYLSEYAEAWQNVLGGETGEWNNLQMKPAL